MLRHVVMFTFADGLDKAATAATISTGRVSALTLRIFTQPSCAIHRELCRLQLLRARRVNAPVRRVNAVLRMREPLKSHSSSQHNSDRIHPSRLAQLSGLLSFVTFTFGADAGLDPDRNHDYVIVAEFTDEEAYQASPSDQSLPTHCPLPTVSTVNPGAHGVIALASWQLLTRVCAAVASGVRNASGAP